MTEYTTTYGTTYRDDEKVCGIDISFTMDNTFYTARITVSEPVTISKLITNMVPPSAYQLKLLGVTE